MEKPNRKPQRLFRRKGKSGNWAIVRQKKNKKVPAVAPTKNIKPNIEIQK